MATKKGQPRRTSPELRLEFEYLGDDSKLAEGILDFLASRQSAHANGKRVVDSEPEDSVKPE